MKRKALIVLLALGTLGGFASGVASMSWRHKHRKAYFEHKVTKICADAVRQAQTK
jgi:uncharacterized membrane protein YsdA (DUF1294 family)